MALTLLRRTRPFENLNSWYNEIDRFFEDSYPAARVKSDWYPSVDIRRDKNGYILKADLPGLKKENILLTLENGYLTLSGERKSDHEENKEHYQRLERTYGTFKRTFKVPEGLTEKDIQAKYDSGVLELTIPVPEPDHPKKVNVKID